MKVLRLKIYQPQAHYGIPYSFVIKHTYPIPPYSTVIGLICNVLGVKSVGSNPENYIIESLSMDFKSFANGLYIAVCGKFAAITRELCWFRNLSGKSDKKNSDRNRKTGGKVGERISRFVNLVPCHPGEQIPVKVDVLEDVRLLIYLTHEREDIVERLKEVFINPQNRNHHLHLGRAEDWIVYDGDPEESVVVLDEDKVKVSELVGKCDFYMWLPDYRARSGDAENGYVQEEFEKVRFPHFPEGIV